MKSLLIATSILFFPLLMFGQDTSKTEVDSSKVIEFEFPEVYAEFPGGIDSMYNFLRTNMEYPVKAKDAQIQGKVFVEFIVWTDGTIRDVKVLKGIGGGCDEEAIRVIEMMPNWVPATMLGENIPSKFMLPIDFHLKDRAEVKSDKKTNREERRRKRKEK